MEKIIRLLFLAGGLVWACLLLKRLLTDKRPEEGGKSLGTMLLTEGILYFITSMGISDFLMNTVVFHKFRSGDADRLPGTLMLCAVVPGSFLAYAFLRGAGEADTGTLVLCTAGMLLGALAGGRLTQRLDGRRIKTLLGYALILSMAALIGKMIFSAGLSGTATGLSGWRLGVAVLFSMVCGALNMVGVPAKPTLTAVFLLLGLSPLCTLTLLLVMCGLSPMAASVPFYRSGRYHRRTVLAAVLTGTAGAVAGGLLMISLPAAVLNILLLGVMLLAIVTTLRK